MSVRPLSFRDNTALLPWQSDAVAAWRASRSPSGAARHGIIEAVTGTGKTIAAMACMVDAAAAEPALRFAIVVPGKDLALQWRSELLTRLNLEDRDVGLVMTNAKASLRTHRVVIWVVNSARTKLASDCRGHQVMLVVDECHRTGSPQNRKLYAAKTIFRLGLSATARRMGDVDENGVKLQLDKQFHAQALGPSCYQLTVAKATALGMLPPFQIVHHGIGLSPLEDDKYRRLTVAVNDAFKRAADHGLSRGQVVAALKPGGRFSPEQRAAALDVQATTLARKHFLYLRPERNRVAAALLARAFADAHTADHDLQAILFNERIAPTSKSEIDDESDPDDDGDDDDGDDVSPLEPQTTPEAGAEQLYHDLIAGHADGALAVPGDATVVIRRHHSQHPDTGAIPAMKLAHDDPRRARVLVTVKGAVEGIDLPNADLGVIVASSSAPLQRIQTLGRILRPRRHANGAVYSAADYENLPLKTLNVIYVKATVDEEIYLNTDWDELLGKEHNVWRTWAFGAAESAPDDAPPIPPMSEDEAYQWLEAKLKVGETYPLPWPTRLGDCQELVYTKNAARIVKTGPPVHNNDEITAALTNAATRLKIDPMQLRSRLFVSMKYRLLLRRVPKELNDTFPVIDPRTKRPVQRAYVVLAKLRELPRIPQGQAGESPLNATEVGGDCEAATPQVHATALDAQAALRAFIAARGVASPALAGSLDDTLPACITLVRRGVLASDQSPTAWTSLDSDGVFACFIAARSRRDDASASAAVIELKRRKAKLAKRLSRLAVALNA